MKRKSPNRTSRASKRRKLNPETQTPQSSSRDQDNELDETEIDSPLVDITNTVNKVSPRPAQLITQQLQNKRILLQTKQKRITLTDDEDNIIHEEEEEEEEDFDDENEIEVARGIEDENKNKSQDLDSENEDNFDPFNITEQSQDQFQTIPGLHQYKISAIY